MMDLGGGKTGKEDDDKSRGSGYQRFCHHLHHFTSHNKSVVRLTLLVIAADLFLVLYRSAYHNPPSSPTSEDFQNYFPSQYFSSGQANTSSVSQNNSTVEGNLPSPASYVSSPPHDDSPPFSSADVSSKANQSSRTESVGELRSSSTDSAQGNQSSPVHEDDEETKLKRVLNKAATVNKTIIFTTVNAAWITPGSLFDLFLEGFRIGNQTKYLLNHLVVVAVDQKAYSRCLEIHQHCYALITEGVDFSGKADFMSSEYLKMMWRRLDFMRTILELGYNFIFTDTDIIWFRDPFPQFYADADFQIACDHFRSNSTDLNNAPNGGFMHTKSNNITIEFYKFWYKSKETYPGRHEQDVLNFIKFDPFLKKIGLKVRFLDTAYFGGFCEPSMYLNFVCTMHANCCTSLDGKIHGLRMLMDDWNKYMASPKNSTITESFWRRRRHCAT